MRGPGFVVGAVIAGWWRSMIAFSTWAAFHCPISRSVVRRKGTRRHVTVFMPLLFLPYQDLYHRLFTLINLFTALPTFPVVKSAIILTSASLFPCGLRIIGLSIERDPDHIPGTEAQRPEALALMLAIHCLSLLFRESISINSALRL